MFLGITPVSSVSNGLYFVTLPPVSVMRVIYTSKGMSKKLEVRVIYRKIWYIFEKQTLSLKHHPFLNFGKPSSRQVLKLELYLIQIRTLQHWTATWVATSNSQAPGSHHTNISMNNSFHSMFYKVLLFFMCENKGLQTYPSLQPQSDMFWNTYNKIL
jgi:hypothetical protein